MMPLSAFVDKSHEPTGDDLREVLSKAFDVWTNLLSEVDKRIGPIFQVWGYSSKATGWGLRVKRQDRIILYMTPQAGQFLLSFALGEKAVAAAKEGGLSAEILNAIDSAPRYAEGRGLRLEVCDKLQVSDLVRIAQIKSEN
jgi:hypothetical protein